MPLGTALKTIDFQKEKYRCSDPSIEIAGESDLIIRFVYMCCETDRDRQAVFFAFSGETGLSQVRSTSLTDIVAMAFS